MTKSKAGAAAGILAACAGSSPAGAATPASRSPASAAAGAPAAAKPSLLDRMPRGGYSPASAEAGGAAGGGAGDAEKGSKKKRRPRQRQQQKRKNEKETASSKGGGSPLPAACQSILSQSCHYDVLGVTKDATQVQIQKAYRRRCVLTHPDKTAGDRSAFDKVSEAYDVLSCENKRAIYDKFGKAGLESGMDMNNMQSGPFGMGGASAFFGGDPFREFFGAQQGNPFQRPSRSRPRDLRYQLEVTLEELYAGATKRVLIQQPNPLRPHFPYRKEVEVTLEAGAVDRGELRLHGAADCIPDVAPADVVFLIKERRHRAFTRKAYDLAMELKISFAESIVGFRGKIGMLDGSEIEIGSPAVEKVVQKEETVDAADSPTGGEDRDANVVLLENIDVNGNNATTPITTVEEKVPERIVRNTTITYKLPPSVIKTGDVHVLKGHGMPKKGMHHGENSYGDLYIQYVVEAPGTSSSPGSRADVDNLTPEERVELARLLSKLEGGDDPTRHAVTAGGGEGGEGEKDGSVHRLSPASATDFGSSATAADDHDEHLRHDEDHGSDSMPQFFQQAFGSGAGGSGFRYFSSSAGGFGYQAQQGGEREHKVECNQM